MQEKLDYFDVNKRIILIMKEKGYNKNSLAKAMGMSQPTIKQIESNENLPSLKFLLEFKGLFSDINYNWLLTGKGNKIDIVGEYDIAHEGVVEYDLDGGGYSMRYHDGVKSRNAMPVSQVEIKKGFSLQSDRPKQEQMVPLYELEASAGITELFIGQHQVPMEQLYIPNLTKCDGAVFVRGDSMTPLISPGDIVLFKQVNNIEDGILWGEIYMVSFNIADDQYLAIKYIRKSEKGGHVTLASLNPNHKPQDIPLNTIKKLAIIKAAVKYTTMM